MGLSHLPALPLKVGAHREPLGDFQIECALMTGGCAEQASPGVCPAALLRPPGVTELYATSCPFPGPALKLGVSCLMSGSREGPVVLLGPRALSRLPVLPAVRCH